MNIDDFKSKPGYAITFNIEPDFSKGETEETAKEIFNQLSKKLSSTDLVNEQDVDIVEHSNNIMTIEEATKIFLEHKTLVDKLKPSSQKGYNTAFKYLFLFFSKDTKINKISILDFRAMQNIMLRIPKTYLSAKKYKSIPIRDIVKKDFSPDTLTTKVINQHLQLIGALYKYLVFELHLKTNPVLVRTLPEEPVSKVEYSDKDLKLIFSTLTDYNIIEISKFALYQGMRIGEILQLKKSDIDDNFINIKEYLDEDLSIKNKSSIRKVPIHSKIKDMIDERLEEDGEFLFYDGKKGKHTKAINKALNKVIPDKTKTFHSFRKNFVQKLYAHKPIIDRTIIKILIGHTTNEDITFKDYNCSKVEDVDLVDSLNCVRFKNIENDEIEKFDY